MSVVFVDQTTVDTPSTDYLTIANKSGDLILKDDAGTETYFMFAAAALTAGRVVFVGTGGVLDDDSELLWNNTTKRLGIGIAPTEKLQIESEGASSKVFYITDGGNDVATIRQTGSSDSLFELFNAAGSTKIRLHSNGASFVAGGNFGIGVSPSSPLTIALATENFEIVDAGSAGATEQDWIEVEIGGVQGYLHVHPGK